MTPENLDIFLKSTVACEGHINWPYLDIKGLVTVGYGFLIDPFSLATSLHWTTDDGKELSDDEVWRQWRRVKERRELAHRGAYAAKAVSSLRLTDDELRRVFGARVELNEQYLAAHIFPAYGSYPADVQLAIMSMAWAMGAGGFHHFPKFCAAVKTLDWSVAAKECFLNARGNPGLVPRNWANRKLLLSAAEHDGDPDQTVVRGYP